MNKKLIILFISTLSLCFAQDFNSIYKEAKELEDSGDYKSAMLLYKKIANESFKNSFVDKNENSIAKEIKKEPKKEFFEKNGFVEIPKENIPEHKIWADCIKCKHFPICNEISLIKTI